MPERPYVLPPNLPPRGLSREQAAAYVGVSVTTFDLMVADGRMPQPREINRRNVWDRIELDEAFARLPHKGHSAVEFAV
jgi:predicted DNA-binding transcriptional regulator AlpA